MTISEPPHRDDTDDSDHATDHTQHDKLSLCRDMDISSEERHEHKSDIQDKLSGLTIGTVIFMIAVMDSEDALATGEDSTIG